MSTTTAEQILKASAPAIKVNGADMLAADLARLTSLRVEVGYCTIGRATLRFVDRGYELSAQSTLAIGTEVAVSAYSPHAKAMELVFGGEVVSVALEQGPGQLPELVVVVDECSHRLARNATAKTYTNLKASDALSKIISGAGLQSEMTATSVMHPYLLQGGTDLDHVQQLTARAGLVWSYQHPKKVKVHKPDADTTVVPYDLDDPAVGRTFSVRASARNVGGVKVTGWNAGQLKQVVGDAPATTASPSTFATVKSTVFGTSALARSDLAPLSADEATELAKSLNAEAASQMVTARGTSIVEASLRPGVQVEVKNAGPASGKYRVTEVEHRYDGRGFTTTFTAGPLRGGGLVDLLGGAAPPRHALSMGNLHIGVVSAICDKANTDQGAVVGMVRVKMSSLPGEPESAWARVVTLGGGKDRGALFLPEINDEVLVGFEEGDTRRPVVIGGLFSTKNKFPGDSPVKAGKIEARRITSRTGHKIEMSDDAKNGHVLLSYLGKEHSIMMSKEGIEITAVKDGKIKLATKGGSITITDTGDITIEGKGAIEVKATKDVSAEGLNATVKGKTGATVEGGTTVKVAAKGQASLEGGMTAVKGQMVKIGP